jgi:hypothetical protein
MKTLSKERLATDCVEMTIDNREGLDNMMKMLGQIELEYPISVQIQKKGKRRTNTQNNTANKWYRDCEKQGDMKAWEYRAYCKLHFGIPILRRDSEKFKEVYDSRVKPYSYEQKLSFMVEPFDFEVTSLMNIKQHSEFLDMVERHLREQGFELTEVRR